MQAWTQPDTGHTAARKPRARKLERQKFAPTLSPRPSSLGQESLLVGLGISDLVDQEADSTLGNDVRCTVMWTFFFIHS